MKIASNIGKAFLVLSGLILLIELFIYALTPVYDFPEPVPFHGDSIYNPYQGIHGNSWQKGYTLEDMRYLTIYNLVEALDNNRELMEYMILETY